MADDCERHENGFQTARNPMTRPGAGKVNDPAFAYLGGLGCGAQMDTNMWEYISSIIAAASKVWGGHIHEIEAVGWAAPYQIPDVFGVK